MSKQDEFREIVSTYEKHGWIPRRFLFTRETRQLQGLVLGDVPITESEIDAIWFSRPPEAGQTSWELRSLGATPFALVEFLDENSSSFEESLRAIQHRMIESLAKRKRLDN